MDPQQNFFGAPPPAETPPPTAPPVAVPMTPEAAGPSRTPVPTWGDSGASTASDYAPEPQPYEPPPPAAPAEPSIEELKRQVEGLNKRLADTQQSFHRANNNAQLAQEIVHGLASYAEQRRQRDYAAEQFRPPVVDDPDALLTDPNALIGTMGRYGEYVRQSTLAEVAPHLQAAAGIAAIAPTIVQYQMESVARDVAHMAAQEGVSREEFPQLLEQAAQIIEAGTIPPHEKVRLRLRPDAMMAALRLARDARGPRTPAPPSLGPGGVSGQPRRQVAGDIARVEQMLGIKFDKNDQAELNRRLAAQGVR